MPNYSEIDAKQSLWKNREAVLHHQIRTLRDLIRHAWGKSSFYRDLYRSHGIKEKDIGDLKVDDLPFISKQILMDNFDDMVTDSRLRKKELEEWILSRRDPSKTFAKDFIVINSSGSSGNIGLFVFDQKAYNVMASTMAMRLPPPKEGIRTKIAFYRVCMANSNSRECS